MQDFRNLNNQNIKRVLREAAPAPAPNKYGGIYDRSKAPEIGFIKARMNKDNFWNIVFFLIVVISVWVAESIARTISFGLVLPFTIPTLIATLFLLAKLNPVNFADNLYTSKSDRSVAQGNFCPGATLFFWALWCVTFFGIMSIALIKERFFTTAVTPIVGSYFFILIMYCILKNIPFGVFYHKKAWGNDGHPVDSVDVYENHRSKAPDLLKDPIYSSLPGNIYYQNRR